jgi:phytepsin
VLLVLTSVRRFDATQSNSYHKIGYDVEVKFGTGDIEGYIAEEDFSLPGPSGGEGIVVKGQAFGLMTSQVGEVFMTPLFSGIVGLAFPALSAYDFTPLFDNIVLQKLLPEPVFAFVLGVGNEPSAIVMGEPDHSLFEGEIHWIPVSREFYWEVVLSDILVDGSPQHFCGLSADDPFLPPQPARGQLPSLRGTVQEQPQEGDWGGFLQARAEQTDGEYGTEEPMDWDERRRNAGDMEAGESPLRLRKGVERDGPVHDTGDRGCKLVLDTGTSLLTAPTEVVRSLNRQLPLDSNCNGMEGLPTLTYVIHGQRFDLKPEDYVIRAPGDEVGGDRCKVGFMALDVPPPRGPLFVLGDIFTQVYVTFFDRENVRVGFARRKKGALANASPSLLDAAAAGSHLLVDQSQSH